MRQTGRLDRAAPTDSEPGAAPAAADSHDRSPAGDDAAFRLTRHGLLSDGGGPEAAPSGRVGPDQAQVDVARRIAGLHAQVMSSADLSLWTRLPGHARGDLDRLLWEERRLVKTWLMRGTLHLVPADDLPLFAAALDPDRYDGAWHRAFAISAEELERLIDAIRDALDGQCLTREELGAAIASRLGGRFAERLRSGWGELLKPAARRGVLCFGPNRGQNVTFARPDQWLGAWRQVEREDARRELVRRYLRAYGPGTREDAYRWLGVRGPRFRAAWQSVAAESVEVAPTRFLLADDLAARRSAPDAEASVRLLPAFDPFLLGHADRAHLIEEAHRSRLYRTAGWVSPAILVAGRVVGVWSHERQGSRVGVVLHPFAPLAGNVRESLEAEARRLAQYLGGDLHLDVVTP